MDDLQDRMTNISLILSRVMDDIGVNEECVMRRRRTNLVRENLYSLYDYLRLQGCTYCIFGSQTEGTTTDDLSSDTDIVFTHENVIVIQDLKDWESGKKNLLMLQDEKHYPGYCKLQVLREDAPLPLSEIPVNDPYRSYDSSGNVIHTIPETHFEGRDRHGPASIARLGHEKIDLVLSFRCSTWPNHYKQWDMTTERRDWPTQDTIEEVNASGCFVVPVSHPLDERKETWRISNSLSERCLMFSLNITQIRCYVLLKMIVKTFIEPTLPETISSYMCKALLFRCMEKTSTDFWNEHNLLQCIHKVLLYMVSAVLDENCPNYFNESVNLFFGKVDNRNKKELLSKLGYLLDTREGFLFTINFDQINSRLSMYYVYRNYAVPREEKEIKMLHQYRLTLYRFLVSLCDVIKSICLIFASYFKNHSHIPWLIGDFRKRGNLQNQALRLVLRFAFSFRATVEASYSIRQNTVPNPKILDLFDASLDSDVASSRLKFASYSYCTGQLEDTLCVLEDVKKRMTDGVMTICGCHRRMDIRFNPEFGKEEIKLEYPTTDSLGLCVMFSKAEIYCCPRELRYELFRSTDEEKSNWDDPLDNWMDLSVMDALPYLYFLQYMTYRRLGEHSLQSTPLHKLIDHVQNTESLPHKETTYNVLGQCMEYEGRFDEAFECYKMSLKERPNNNAVRWHILLLLWLTKRGGN